jgi:hypothetical protein
VSGKFHGVMRTKLSNDWRFRILPQWAAVFGERPIVVTLAENPEGWRLRPEPDWLEYFSQGGPLPQWELTQVQSRSRVSIPSAIYYATKIEKGQPIFVVGYGEYLEICSERQWQKEMNDRLEAERAAIRAMQVPPPGWASRTVH